jgi:ribonuclease BN (tRNA processing enzyme)
MKFTFLGSSHGVPAPDRFCSSLMVEVGESVYLVDAGAPIIDCILRHDKTTDDVKAIFTTHSHGDHINGLHHYIDLVDWYYKESEVDIFMTNVEVKDAMINMLEVLRGAPYHADRIRMHIAEAGQVWDDSNLRVTYIPTRHMEPRASYAILLEAEGKRVCFSGDLAYGLGDYPTVVSQVETDLFVCEMAHFTGEEIAPRLDNCKTKKLIFHHYQANKPPQIEALATSGRFGFPIYMAEDGDCVEV